MYMQLDPIETIRGNALRILRLYRDIRFTMDLGNHRNNYDFFTRFQGPLFSYLDQDKLKINLLQ
jgi:hypothetical protein